MGVRSCRESVFLPQRRRGAEKRAFIFIPPRLCVSEVKGVWMIFSHVMSPVTVMAKMAKIQEGRFANRPYDVRGNWRSGTALNRPPLAFSDL
jgi:hypothetical protein